MSNDLLKLKVSLINKGDRGHARAEGMTWAEVMDLLDKPIIDKRHTQAQYNALDADEKADVKDVGSYVPGIFRAGIRRSENLIERTAITLDIDEVTPRQVDTIMDGLTPLAEFEFFASTTRSHTPKDPRWRIVLPLARPIAPEEYAPLARIIASKLLTGVAESMDAVDTVSFRAAQVMYLPSRSKNGEFESAHNRGQLINPDEIFDTWGDWQDLSKLPYSEKRGVGRERVGVKAEDPTTKHGVVGAFCRTYTVQEAIKEFLPDIYKPSRRSGEKPRYTFTGGSGTNGVVVEDGGLFIYSHHGTDPCGGRLVNAFDMVRLHKFGDVDEGYDEDGNPTSLPSYKSMSDLARSIAAVELDFENDQEERMAEQVMRMFDESDEEEGYVARAREDDSDIADEFDDLEPLPKPSLKGIPKHLLTIPGALGAVVDYYNATAMKPQPQFAVQAALALGSVVLGRNWKTNKNNWSSLFLLNVAPTTAGKEHARRVVEEVLETAGEGDLIGPKSYTSEAGVMSALLMRPRHISITDEFGRYLSSARSSGNAHKQDAQSAFMEIYGNLGGVFRGNGYSTHGMTANQAEEVKNRKVVRPALTLFGMTTPDTLYEALGAMDVKDGYLNRYLIVASPIGRQLSRDVVEEPVPEKVIRWVRNHAWMTAASDEDDMADVRAKIEPGMLTEPVIVPFHRECNTLLVDMEREIIAEQDKLDTYGMADLLGRTREMAMKISLIVAVSCESRQVRLSHLEWAWDYVYFYHRQMVEMFTKNLGRSEFELIAEDVMLIVRSAGKDGVTEREIVHRSRPYKRLDRRGRDEVISRLQSDYDVAQVEMSRKGLGGRGRPRKAYVIRR